MDKGIDYAVRIGGYGFAVVGYELRKALLILLVHIYPVAEAVHMAKLMAEDVIEQIAFKGVCKENHFLDVVRHAYGICAMIGYQVGIMQGDEGYAPSYAVDLYCIVFTTFASLDLSMFLSSGVAPFRTSEKEPTRSLVYSSIIFILSCLSSGSEVE